MNRSDDLSINYLVKASTNLLCTNSTLDRD